MQAESPALFLLITMLFALVICLPYAWFGKYLMGVFFEHRVWFGLVWVSTVLVVLIATVAEFLYGFGAWMTFDDAFTEVGLQEVAAGFVLQIALYFAFVPNVHIRWISPAKWFVVVLVQYAVTLAITYGTFYYLEPGKFSAFMSPT